MTDKEISDWCNHAMLCASIADMDKTLYEVRHEEHSWEDWNKVSRQLMGDGWELAKYGQMGSLFSMSGYFRRLKHE